MYRKKKIEKNVTFFYEKSGRVFAEMPLSANLFRLRSSMQKHAGSRSAAMVGGAGGAKPPAKNKRLKKKIRQKEISKKFLTFFQ